jgi:hypothetical protein
MSSKMIVLRVLDAVTVVFLAVLAVLALSATGLPVEWLPRLFHMSLREFRGFSFFTVFAAMWLMHAIATSDSAP